MADRQVVVPLQLREGATAGDALVMSGFAATGLRIGIGGKVIEAARVLRNGERVELLRPLALDPKEARRLRAQSSKRRRKR